MATSGLSAFEQLVLGVLPEPEAPVQRSSDVLSGASGDLSTLYETALRLARPWQTRYPLVRVEGNGGSLEGDPPAEPRLTGLGLTSAGALALADQFPHALVNGPAPLNLGELATGQPLGPDFATGGVVVGDVGPLLSDGAADLLVQARAHVEPLVTRDFRSGDVLGLEGHAIVLTALPPHATLRGDGGVLQELDEQADRLGITEFANESTEANVRLVLELAEDAHPESVWGALLSSTSLAQVVKAQLGAPLATIATWRGHLPVLAAEFADSRRTELATKTPVLRRLAL